MLRRKAYENLLAWKKTKEHEALLIKGARQIGKTFLVREFGKNEYKSFIEINFLEKFHSIYAIKLIDGNLGTSENKLVLPHFMAMFL